MSIVPQLVGTDSCSAAVTREEVERAIREGVRLLEEQQRADGSWADVENEAKTGTTSLVTLALLTAGEKPDSPAVRKAHRVPPRLRPQRPEEHLRDRAADHGLRRRRARARPVADRRQCRVARTAQIKPGDPVNWPGSWTYSDSKRTRPGDNSNTQYALLGLHAASEAGVPVKPEVWELCTCLLGEKPEARRRLGLHARFQQSTASMTCAGISSLIISGLRRFQGQEFLQGETIQNCGKGGVNRNLRRASTGWPSHFQVGQNFGDGQQWKFYYLYGLERAGRLTGMRFFGQHDWYRLGAEELVHDQDKLSGFWEGALIEADKVLATSFALLFLAKGRAPVLDQQAAPWPQSATGTTTPTTSATS